MKPSILLLSLLALVSAALTIRARYHGPRRALYLFKPLTLLLIIGIALVGERPVSMTYQLLIVAGLAASLIGDVCILDPDRLQTAMFSFLIAHALYIIAFTAESSGTAPLWYVIPFILYGGMMLWQLWPNLGHMKRPVVIYISVILLMAWQAANRWIETNQPGSLIALMGAYLFVASDSILAVERFKGRFRSAQVLILGTYFAAQWLIALSV